eukprot:364229-Chlamydomonas_euryale.AAC.7
MQHAPYTRPVHAAAACKLLPHRECDANADGRQRAWRGRLDTAHVGVVSGLACRKGSGFWAGS